MMKSGDIADSDASDPTYQTNSLVKVGPGLTMPGGGMFMWPRIFFVAPLSGGAGLGSLSSTALRFLDSEGKVCQKFKGKVFF